MHAATAPSEDRRGGAESVARRTRRARRIIDAALRIADAAHYRSLGTLEFLVEGADTRSPRIVFIEANPRLQVEHTVTEEVTGVDLVKTQIRIAGGATLRELHLSRDAAPKPRGFALQARVNMETMTEAGDAKPAGGTLTAFAPPNGPGVRVDTFGYSGYTTSPNYDSLLAKVIVHSASNEFADVLARARRALGEFAIGGVATNLAFLRALLGASRRRRQPHLDALCRTARRPNSRAVPPRLRRNATAADGDARAIRARRRARRQPRPARRADARQIRNRRGGNAVDGSRACPTAASRCARRCRARSSRSTSRSARRVRKGQQLLVMEAMKMEHVIAAPASGIVQSLAVARGRCGIRRPTCWCCSTPPTTRAITPRRRGRTSTSTPSGPIWPKRSIVTRSVSTTAGPTPWRGGAKPATAPRARTSTISSIAGSFIEYGPLVVAAQRRRRTIQDLIEKTPADGMVAGVGSVNGHLFDETHARCAVLSYDYTVLAGTQGAQNHRKKDRLFEIAEHARLPIVFFTEGGGGRPGDTDGLGVAGLDVMAFQYFGALSGLVPLIGITSGRCFAGNAVLLGCCDVVIATEGSNIGVGGPAMIEGGGLGVFRPEEVGPMSVQVPNGVVDIAVKDEAEAVAVAKKYLSYFQGPVKDWTCADQRLLRSAIPENRLRVYDVRKVIETLADTDSVLEIRRGFGHGIVTAFIRIEGRPIGVIANNPTHLAGAIDSPGADKAARFMQLCDAFDIPLLFLCDCPGIMVGPEIEKTALVRHASRMFVTGSIVTVPFFTIVLRKSYGLGAQAMAGGSFKAPFFAVSWPTGEFGGMGLEGAVKLGYRNELAAIEDPEQRTNDLRRDGRADVRTRQRRQRRVALRDRRRDRSDGVAPLGRCGAQGVAAAAGANRQEATLRRYVVRVRRPEVGNILGSTDRH